MDDSERLDHDIDTICMNLGEWEDKFNDLEKENAELKDKCEKAYYSGWRDREKAREDGWPAILTKPLTWTRERPTEAGWYWFSTHPEHIGALITELVNFGKGLQFYQHEKGTTHDIEYRDGFEWSGPIPKPVEKCCDKGKDIHGKDIFGFCRYCGYAFVPEGFKVGTFMVGATAYPEEVPETAEPDKRHCCHNYLNKSFFMALSTVPGIKRFYYNFCPQCGMGLKHGPAFLKQFI